MDSKKYTNPNDSTTGNVKLIIQLINENNNGCVERKLSNKQLISDNMIILYIIDLNKIKTI